MPKSRKNGPIALIFNSARPSSKKCQPTKETYRLNEKIHYTEIWRTGGHS